MKLDDMRGFWAGEHALVVAPGPSALRVTQSVYESHWTMGCNRAVAFCRPDFAVCVEPPRDSVWPVIMTSRPSFIFTQQEAKSIPRKILFSRFVSDFLPTERHKLNLSMSPFYGAAIAIALGFERVGLIGVDLDGDGGRFSNTNFQEEWEDCWGELYEIAKRCDVDLVNLNPRSKLKAVPSTEWATMEPKR